KRVPEEIGQDEADYAAGGACRMQHLGHVFGRMHAGIVRDVQSHEFLELALLKAGDDRGADAAHDRRLKVAGDAFGKEGGHYGGADAPYRLPVAVDEYGIDHDAHQPCDAGRRPCDDEHAEYGCRYRVLAAAQILPDEPANDADSPGKFCRVPSIFQFGQGLCLSNRNTAGTVHVSPIFESLLCRAWLAADVIVRTYGHQ